MESQTHMWAVVLAAGQGTRLKSITTNEEGVTVPKQFCSFLGTKSMLGDTLERAERIVPRERIIVIVSAEHRQWWEPELSEFPEENILLEPKNSGTAVAVLKPVLHVFQRDRQARILVLPSDHYIGDQGVLEESIRKSFPISEGAFNRLILLGMTPTSPDAGYGWIVPSSSCRNGLSYEVGTFVEKPPASVAVDLMKMGALWNSFMTLGAASTFLRLYKKALPDLLREFRDCEAIEKNLLALDFSRDLLQRVVARLWVVPVPHCGWSDLGTPDRIKDLAKRLSPSQNVSRAHRDPILTLPKKPATRPAAADDLQMDVG